MPFHGSTPGDLGGGEEVGKRVGKARVPPWVRSWTLGKDPYAVEPITTQVGITPAELDTLVSGEVWIRWCGAEPDLARVGSLAEIDALRGAATDGPLGALVRLAARDGGDDELAAIAVVHQLGGGVQELIRQFRNLTADVDAVVIGALWERIRTFPWRSRTRSYAASLIYDTRTDVVAFLLPGRTRWGAEPVVFVDPQSWVWEVFAGTQPQQDRYDGAAELMGLLGWAVKSQIVTGEDARLLVELVAADREKSDGAPTRRTRGACSVSAVEKVAGRRGICTRTVFRRRDHVVARLREVSPRYLVEAA